MPIAQSDGQEKRAAQISRGARCVVGISLGARPARMNSSSAALTDGLSAGLSRKKGQNARTQMTPSTPEIQKPTRQPDTSARKVPATSFRMGADSYPAMMRAKIRG